MSGEEEKQGAQLQQQDIDNTWGKELLTQSMHKIKWMVLKHIVF